MSISREDRGRISAAIHAAESRTSGEIVCVLAQTSLGTTALPIFVAAAVALAVPWVLMAMTHWSVREILSVQVVLFVGIVLLLGLPRVRVALVPRAARRAAAYRAAMEQFTSRGIAQTKERTGVLIFVSLAERYARIVADEGIAAVVPQAEWQAAIDALISHTRDGRIADGFITAVEKCGMVLAANFPATSEARDELPDRVFLV